MKVVWKLLVVMVALVAAGFAVLVLPMIIADLPRTNFQKNLKKRATAEELQTWAAGVLTAYQTNRDPGLWIELTNIPVAFHGLYKRGPSAYVYSDSQARFDSTEPVAYVRLPMVQPPDILELYLDRQIYRRQQAVNTKSDTPSGNLGLGFSMANEAPNEVTSADGRSPLLFAFVAQWPAAAEFRR